jgi:hypothetical protein
LALRDEPRAKGAHTAQPFSGVLRQASRAARKLSGQKPIEGFVDRVLAGEVLGWAFDPNKPNRRVHITARIDGEIIAEALADLPRKDLIRGGKGDGRHGFNLRIPARYLDGEPRQLRIEAASGRARSLLQGGVFTIAASRPGAAPKRIGKPPAQAAGHGALESVADGVLHGWAAHPKNGGTAAVVDIYDDERYLGSVTADRPRNKTVDGEASGAKAFHFRLPKAPDAAMLGRLRARIAGTQIELARLAAAADAGGAPAANLPPPPAPARPRRPARLAPAEGRVALLVYGEEDADAVRRTTRSWTDQTWSDVAIGRLSRAPGASSPAGEHVFGAEDLGRLRDFLESASTAVFLRAGETMEPPAARILAQVRPLCDVLTWDVADRSGGAHVRRRSEAWPLAIQLGASLEHGFAVRVPALTPLLSNLGTDMAAGGIRGLELALARAPGVRWAHLPSVLSTRAPLASPPPRFDPVAGPGKPRRLSFGVWPRWSDASMQSLLSLLARAGEGQAEVLVPADAASAALEREIAAAAPHLGVVMRPVDVPIHDRLGVWHRALSEAATGDVVVLCRAGVILEGPTPAVAEMAAWAMSPLVGAVTAEVSTGDQTLAGLALQPSRNGWRIVSAFDPGQQGASRPVLAAPAALLAIERGKLAAAGGFDAHRLTDGGTGFDLGLRLRRAGYANILLGGIGASAESRLLKRDASPALALHDLSELAGAAAAYPAPVEIKPEARAKPPGAPE